MKKYWVTLPVCGTVEVEVEADNESEAIDKAMDVDPTGEDAELQWSTYRKLLEGNVFYGDASSAYAEEIEEERP